METVYLAEFAGHAIRYAFLYPKTKRYFRGWLKPVEGETYDVKATPELVAEAHLLQPEENPEDYAEYKALTGLTSKYLLRYGSCIFHAAAFLWRGRAWLLTAPSGTGKTTQFLNWRRLHPGEITMICGDMPVLERREDGSLWIHPTSWTGKENIGSFSPAPLGGVILLEQGRENRMETLSPRNAIEPLIGQFIADPETEQEICTICGLLDRMLSEYPVWKLVNLGDDASTELLRRTIAERTGGANGTV